MDMADIVDRLARDIVTMYAEAEADLLRAIQVELLTGDNTPGLEEMYLRMGKLRQAAREIVEGLETRMPEVVDGIMSTAIEGGRQAVVNQLSALGITADIGIVAGTVTGSVAATFVKVDLVNKLSDLHNRILRYPDDVYQKVVGRNVTSAILGTSTNRQSQQASWREFLSEGVYGFVDKSGRNWNLATYTEMASRTAIMRAWDEAHNSQMGTYGMDLVTPIVRQDACDRCARWAGKIMAIKGVAGDQQMEHATNDGEFINVHVDSTVEAAREDGFKHPNCVCVLVAYLPGLSVPADAVKHDPELEKNREDLRAAERAVRKAKRELALATPLEEAAYRSDLNEARAKIRDIVKNTPQLRKRYREQLNLGNTRR
ncbi:hypothetical protein CQ010_01505 [Arthrobacter sp. MYb211]|nr:hypothetical protein CQ015_03760 [Arthrobacter sp. MYb221]PRC10547.1 hypothetical protein CQ010_01505 [Arthrobacter sp. MYb211]